ncbi:type II toxin-antitoxin system RelE/ParE family toxin [Aquibium carbonis]|uniref:Type II toxin-antitoxin system RelE/ParE family toxin n=1 Tax=Aquibium carbonis TaxID=2495581 RepID=A0A3R9ZY03_9HYPH|nr:type II toxin-antitoxin system RelE/ParE family toxin [Aquibium carbonis]RST84462.1 type II toxin-antitoxin system RelE/ParE family toxin [Aquibium carbonis]
MWTVDFDAQVDRELVRLAPRDRQRILRFLRERVAPLDNPRDLGEALAGSLSGYWKYRVGDYRVIAKIEDRKVTILVVRIGHRREVYR